MSEARMTPEELAKWVRMSGLSRGEFARRVDVGTNQLRRMETGREIIPARFDTVVEAVVDAALFAEDDPGPG